MNTKKIEVGVIGLGVGRWHLQTYKDSKYVKKIHICDFNKNLEKKMLKVSKKVSIAKFDDILKNKNVKIISIASYDNYHFSQIIKCLNNKKHVYVEKPICMTKKELKKIIITQKKTGLYLSSNLVLRSNPLFKDLKKKIKNNFFGNVYYIEGDYLWGRANKFYGWRSKLKYYSKIFGAAVHMIDTITWMLNEKPQFVFAEGNKIATQNQMKFNTFVFLNLIFKNNLIVKITGNGPCIHPHFHSINIFGSKKTFLHNHQSSKIFLKKKINNLNIKNSEYPGKKSRKEVLNSFINGVIKNDPRKFQVDTGSVYDVMNICLSAEESMKIKKRIKINY